MGSPLATLAPTEEQVVQSDSLRIADRCDRCGAQAFVRVLQGRRGRGALTLDFCGHHYAKHERALSRQKFAVLVDTRDTINATSASSA